MQIPLKEEIGGETEDDFMDNSIVFIANSKGSCSLTFYTFIIKYSFLDLLNFWSNEHLCMLTIFCSTTTIKSITTSGYVDDRFKLKWCLPSIGGTMSELLEHTGALLHK